MKQIITARAPGKIILSGEHAVVYGKPALALAVNYFATTTISSVSGSGITFGFLNEDNHTSTMTIKELHDLRYSIAKRYLQFIQGKCSIGEVIKQPLELVQYAFSYLMENLSLNIPGGINIQIDLSLPLGCGMGASAAVILSLMHAILGYVNSLKEDHIFVDKDVFAYGEKLSSEQYLYFGKEIENMQHGRSSGLDLYVSLYGGCHLFVAGSASKRYLLELPLVLVNTGKPNSSTGECVAKVAPYLQQQTIAEEFARTTKNLDLALQHDDYLLVRQCIHRNHELLYDIGVVPSPVASFINEVIARGNVAKISGAGAVCGESAGIVLVLGTEDITDLTTKYGYTILPNLGGEAYGLRFV